MRRSAGKYRKSRPHNSSRYEVNTWFRVAIAVAVFAVIPGAIADGSISIPGGLERASDAEWVAVDDAYTISSRPDMPTGGIPEGGSRASTAGPTRRGI